MNRAPAGHHVSLRPSFGFGPEPIRLLDAGEEDLIEGVIATQPDQLQILREKPRRLPQVPEENRVSHPLAAQADHLERPPVLGQDCVRLAPPLVDPIIALSLDISLNEGARGARDSLLK